MFGMIPCVTLKINDQHVKVHLIKEKTIHDFILKYAGSKASFEDWLEKISQADWEIASDIKGTYRSADLLGNGSNRVVFDIGGNNYRMLGEYMFGKKMVHLFVCWIGTHAEYDKLCKKNEQYSVNNY